MSDVAQGLTKLTAMIEIERQIMHGQAILGRPLDDADDLERAHTERAFWTLQNRKLFYQLFSDAAALSRVTPPKPEGPAPFTQQATAFRANVEGQLEVMRRVVRFLEHLA